MEENTPACKGCNTVVTLLIIFMLEDIGARNLCIRVRILSVLLKLLLVLFSDNTKLYDATIKAYVGAEALSTSIIVVCVITTKSRHKPSWPQPESP